MACLVIENKWGLRCRSTQSNKPAEAKFARTAKIGDHWLPDTDDLVTLIIEADLVRIPSDPGNIFALKGDAMIRTAKRIIRGEQLVYTHEELLKLLRAEPPRKP